jgi:hypothetical protein
MAFLTVCVLSFARLAALPFSSLSSVSFSFSSVLVAASLLS